MFQIQRTSAKLLFASLLWLFLFAQSSAIIHAEIHPFHHHSEYCDQFDAVQQISTDPLAIQLTLVTSGWTTQFLATDVPSTFATAFKRSYAARAPPTLI